MGFSPSEVDRMSVWQFAACLDGYLASKGVEQGMSAADRDRAAAMLDHLESL